MPIRITEPVAQNGSNVFFSPDGSFVTSCVGSRLIVYDAASLETMQIFSCVDKIEKCEISPDSEYIMCGLSSRGIIQCFAVKDPSWRCRINESVAGIITAQWSPDSRHILIESDFGIQLVVWSLVDNSSTIISSPKARVDRVFSDCGR